MITIGADQINQYLAAFLFPLVRILAWLSADPLLGNRAAPVSARVALGFILTVAIAPTLPPPPQVALVSGEGLLILTQQILIGAAIGFALRIVFAAVEFAGQFIGLQMGLSFATLFDPINGAQTPVIAQFLVLTTALLLFAFDGHHLVLEALAHSFKEIPIGATPIQGEALAGIVRWGGVLFEVGLHIALPVTAALLSANLAIGMMTRAAPQLNIFAVGFPITLAAGFSMLYFSMLYFPPIIARIWEEALGTVGMLLHGLVAP